ncbi:hypothetical protein LTR99_007012 [Exophiala xenobiotica]|uniref:Uncharacterized protein n=1 Tax=Vermiconidia calcicola TaxID=1690605 RepID=A0AAV9Q059_9PEZI|nr:hypothetical protein LTR96_005274 [Exophiala xenobiotica]KAK5532013.1 hypothetical protein LTR25_008343 [Vermiconidia calcicola]KAK5300265.1 hypothetical protein LTR99_007012 [Exophiala xenobiotica]KAK5339496.1 hypothetical protein LTR98_004297 [Exophiala xenobiotica]KAK5428268.1 hypothetical protein LTR34_008044 [Exophiala xenobiotica]
MLDNLALPFLLAASSCTRSNIRKTLVKEAKFLEIHIAPPLGVLRFDLDFRNGVLRRIIDRHSSHNSARGVLTNTSTDRRAALQQMEEEMRFIGDTKTNMQAQASKGQIECSTFPSLGALLETGYGVDLRQQADAHSDHNSSNYLFTFFQALLVHNKDYELLTKAVRANSRIFFSNLATCHDKDELSENHAVSWRPHTV